MSMPFRAWTRRSQDFAAMRVVAEVSEKFQSREETATVAVRARFVVGATLPEGHPPQDGHCPHEAPLVGSCSEDILEAKLAMAKQEGSIAKGTSVH